MMPLTLVSVGVHVPPIDVPSAQSGDEATQMMSGQSNAVPSDSFATSPFSAELSSMFVVLCAAAGITLIISLIRRHRVTLASRLHEVRQLEGRAENQVMQWLRGRWTQVVEAIGSTAASVERRLELLGTDQTLAQFRLQQVIAALVAMSTLGAVTALLIARLSISGVVSVMLSLVIGALTGAAVWDQLLSVRAQRRQRVIDSQVPDMSDLLALAVGAGESIPGALSRVSSLTASDLSREISRTVSELSLGKPTSQSLIQLAERNDSPALNRLCQTMVTAIERGSPLAKMLHDQAQDIREYNRQRLMEEGGKREILMLFPVVFLILPITVLFALYPGLAALRIGP